MPEILERLAASRQAVEQSCQMLLTPFPEVLDQCSGILSRAIVDLSAGHARIRDFAGNPAVLAEVHDLESKVFLASRLLESAASYHFGWDRISRSMIGGYTAGGAAASFEPCGRLAVEG